MDRGNHAPTTDLIVAHEVTNYGIDRDQLTSMAKLACTEMGVDKPTAVADKGYYKSEEILACHEAGITACSQDEDLGRNVRRPLRQRRFYLR
jgi:hypothetical protein